MATTARNAYFATYSTSSKGKPCQSQSPLHKKQYYKFLTDNSNHQGEQTLREHRIITDEAEKETQLDKQEEFKREIELRFRRSAANPSYQFPRCVDTTDTESQNDSSTDSLEKLSHAIKYDLHSQNLRSYAKPRVTSSVRDLRNISKAQPMKSLKEASSVSAASIKFNMYKPLETLNNQILEKEDVRNTKIDTIPTLDIQCNAVERVKTECYHDQSYFTSRETITTNDTAFSPLNGATLNNFFEHPKTTKNRQVIEFRQATPKGMPFSKRHISPKASTVKHQKADGSAQFAYFAAKKLTESSSANTKIAFKKTAVGSRVSNTNSYGIPNPATEMSKYKNTLLI